MDSAHWRGVLASEAPLLGEEQPALRQPQYSISLILSADDTLYHNKEFKNHQGPPPDAVSQRK